MATCFWSCRPTPKHCIFGEGAPLSVIKIGIFFLHRIEWQRVERARRFDWDRSANHIRARSQNGCTLEAGYMTAPVSFREKVRFFSLAPRAPSIHGPQAVIAGAA